MSKFDNLFNRPSCAKNTISSSLERKSNSFISRTDTSHKPKTYNFLEDEFPDLIHTNIVFNATNIKKYSDITSSVNEIEVVKKNPVSPGWTQYSVCNKTGKIEISYGSKTSRQLQQEKEEAKMNNSLYIYRQMVMTLEENWNRYKKQYDKIHGNGSYDSVYWLESVYPEDEYFSDIEKDQEYDNDEYEYDSYSQDDTKQKNYSVGGKQ